MYKESPSPSWKSRLNDGDRRLQLQSPTTNKDYDANATPISMLSDDILFSIFSMNSRIEMIPINKARPIYNESLRYDEGSLTTVRYSSHVCRRWRNIILSSPTIWANALNIEELNQPGNEWRYEVIDRTGNAPLTLVGQLGFKSSHEGNYAVPFVVDVLSCEWDRIRYLSICTNEPEIEAQLLCSLQEPAPEMKYFLYWTTKLEDEEPDSLPDGEMLFCDLSPKLTFISCDGFSFKFTPGALSNVRNLWLAGYRASFTIPELYHGLRHLPLLEELAIHHHELLESAELGDHTPSISLPRLADITINETTTKLITDLVRHILPAKGCRLVVSSTSLARSTLNDVDLSTLRQFYATFIKNIAQFHSISCISLSYEQSVGFQLRAVDNSHRGKCSLTKYPYLSFNLPMCSSAGLSEQDLSRLNQFSIPIIKALASRRDLGHITTLQLGLDETTIAHSHDQVLAFLRELESVVELITDFSTLGALITIQATASFAILPSTTTLILHGHTSPKHPLVAFLAGRLNSGLPVKVLKLPMGDYSGDGRWRFLRQINGLSVLWMKSRYDFESDVVEELDLGP